MTTKTTIISGWVLGQGVALTDAQNATNTRMVGLSAYTAVNTVLSLTAAFQEDGQFDVFVSYGDFVPPLSMVADFQEDGQFDVHVSYGDFVPPLSPTVDFQEDGQFTIRRGFSGTVAFVEDGTMVAKVRAVRGPVRMVLVVSG